MATFGYTSIGASGVGIDNDIAGTQFDLTENGIVESITAGLFITIVNADAKTWARCAIYDSSNNLVATTKPVEIVGTTKSWYTLPFEQKVTLTPGTYWLTAAGSTDIDQAGLAYDTDATFVGCFQTAIGYPAIPNPLVPGTDNDRKHSIYANYTNLPVAFLTA
jgi:hypothetical protein